MSSDKSVPRILQQPPGSGSDRPQEPAGPADSQSGPGAQSPQQDIGEGSYQATRDYQEDIGDYLKQADVAADAKDARPRSQQEARELDAAEREGRSHSKGER